MNDAVATVAVTVAVTVALAEAAGAVREVTVCMPAGARVRDALTAAGVSVEADTDAGVWGRACSLDGLLREGDRVETYRPLRVDPKTARRERFKRQGARTTGLFAGLRDGAKAGY